MRAPYPPFVVLLLYLRRPLQRPPMFSFGDDVPPTQQVPEAPAFNGDDIDGVLQNGRYVIKLHGLVGAVRKFNGRAVVPEKSTPQKIGKELVAAFTVDISEPGLATQLVVTAGRFIVEADPNFLQKREVKRQSIKPIRADQKWGTVKFGLANLLTQVRKKILISEEQSVADWFGRFDLDGSGDLDMLEFEDALCSIGLALGSTEIDVLFKSLDTDHSGGLDIDEFTAMLKDNTSVRDFHEILKNATKDRRHGRIRDATARVQKVSEPSVKTKTPSFLPQIAMGARARNQDKSASAPSRIRRLGTSATAVTRSAPSSIRRLGTSASAPSCTRRLGTSAAKPMRPIKELGRAAEPMPIQRPRRPRQPLAAGC